MRAVILVSAIALTGCGLSPEYQARIQAQRAAEQAAIEQAEDATCRGYGTQRGSEAYVACRINLANNRQVTESIAAINQERQSEALLGASVTLLQH